MINVKTNESRRYIDVSITGHAGYDVPGNDIVCAAVSMLFQAFVQAADDRGMVSREYEGDETGARVIRCDETEHYYQMLITGLNMLEEQYGQFVRVEGRK